MSLQKAKGKFFASYIALAIISTGVAFTPYSHSKPIGVAGVAISLLGLINTELTFSSAELELEKTEKRINEKSRNYQSEIRDLETKSSNTQLGLKTQLTNFKAETEITINSLKSEIKFVQSQLDEKNNLNRHLTEKLEWCQQELEDCRIRLSEAYKYNSDAVHEIVRNTYNRQIKNVESLIAGFLRMYPEHTASFHAITTDIDNFKIRYDQKIENYQKVVDIEDLHREGLDLQERMIEVCAKYRMKAQQIVIAHLKKVNTDSITFSKHDELLAQAVDKAIEEGDFKLKHQINHTQFIKDDLEGKIKSLCEEWFDFRDETVGNYETDYTEILEALKAAANQITVYEQQIAQLQETIKKLRLPHLFPGQIEKSNIGNGVIIHYWNNFNICLDCAYWVDNDLGYTLYFYIARNNGALITPDTLNDGDLPYALQELTQSLDIPKFELDTGKACVSLKVVKRRKVKTEKEITLPKSVKSADKFAEIVSKWERVRITGGSESGKSPTAENVAICILNARGSDAITFYDPMHDSVKNYRSVPATGVSHADSIEGLKKFASRMQNPPNQTFELVWFDEIDSTMDETPSASKYLKAIFKQASHKNLGLIVTGQNANVSAISGKPPVQRSDMKNMVVVHIGSNYEDGLENSNLPESEKKKLGDIGLKVTEWCTHQNDLEGLESMGKQADVNAYRFALVLEPQKRGYFMLLPDYGQYDYADLVLTSCLPSAEVSTSSSNNHTHQISPNNSSELGLLLQGKKIDDNKSISNIACPNCGSNNVKPYGKQGNRYECLNNCGQKTFRPK